MFACVVDGLLVNTSFQQVDQFKYTIDIPFHCEAKKRGVKVCIFLTGQTPLPAGAAAGIHTSVSPSFSFIPSGFLSNTKPSAIFTRSLPIEGNQTIRIGLSIEQDGQVLQTQIHSSANKDHETARRVAQNFYDYVASFPQAQTQGVPLALLDKWFKNFENKLKHNPQYLAGE